MCFQKWFDRVAKAQKYLDNPKIAKKDTVVYKILSPLSKKGINGKRFSSPYKNFIWHRGFQYTDIPEKRKMRPFIYGGQVNIYEGLYCYFSLTEAYSKKPWSDIVVEMILPKGATYYGPSDHQEIVCSSLIFPLLK